MNTTNVTKEQRDITRIGLNESECRVKRKECGADSKKIKEMKQMKKQMTATKKQTPQKQIHVRAQVRAGKWQFCKALKCNTVDKGGAPNTCQAVECVNN